ncbi:MAG: hypothetical protein ACK40G_17695 [Cytophagaceae bacterium]
MRENVNIYPSETTYSKVRRISWGAIIAGAILAVVIQMTLSILGFGIGIGTVDFTSPNPAQGLGTGSLIWWVVTNLISIFIGAWVAGRLAGVPKPFESMMHGLLTWGVYTIISFYLLTSAVGGILGGATNFIGGTMQTVTSGAMAGGQETVDPLLKELEKRGITIEEGEQKLKEMDTEKLKEQGQAFGEDATQIASRVGIFMAIALILGAIVSLVGGKVGEPHDLDRRDVNLRT